MDDLISRQAAIDNLERYRELFSWDDGDRERAILSRVIKELQSMPTADLSEYSDKLWKAAYERGKAEVHPRTGKWEIDVDCEYDVFDIAGERTWAVKAKCSECGFTMRYIEGHGVFKYCPNCGARMEG